MLGRIVEAFLNCTACPVQDTRLPTTVQFEASGNSICGKCKELFGCKCPALNRGVLAAASPSHLYLVVLLRRHRVASFNQYALPYARYQTAHFCPLQCISRPREMASAAGNAHFLRGLNAPAVDRGVWIAASPPHPCLFVLLRRHRVAPFNLDFLPYARYQTAHFCPTVQFAATGNGICSMKHSFFRAASALLWTEVSSL